MDQATLIRAHAARAWEVFASAGGRGVTAGQVGPRRQTLRTLLEEMAERVWGLTVIDDDTLEGTNIEGELNRQDRLVLLRPGLPPDRAHFVIAHEIGHFALDHPLHVVRDTAREISECVTPGDLSTERQQQVTGLDLSDAALTALRGYNERDLYESQANAFALELLVPEGYLRAALDADPDRPVARLAADLGVPPALVRLGLTGILQPAAAATGAAAGPADAAAADAPAPLDPDQQEAVDCATPALVIAGPGAGKTRVLVSRFARLVNDQGVSPRRILALTFANKAAGEMRARLAALVGPEQAASVEVSTFHAFGLQLLQQYGERIGLKTPVRLITPMDALLLLRRRAARMALGIFSDLPKAMESLKGLLDAVGRSKEEAAGPERWEALARAWREENPDAAQTPAPAWIEDGIPFYREYQATLRRHGLLDYGDLQCEALRLLTEQPDVAREVRERYAHILVDEFQDINYVSGRLVRELDGGRGVVWVVGDPRQSIYGFRGASPVNLSRFRADDYYPGARVIPLTTNYRSLPEIVAAGSAVPIPALAEDPALLPPRLEAHRSREAGPAAPCVTAAGFGHRDDEARWLAAEIRRLHEQEGVPLSGIAVLVRTNGQAARAAQALGAAGVPHRWAGPLEDRPVFRLLYSALLLAADDPAGIVGLTLLAPGALGLAPDQTLTEEDRRRLLAAARSHRGARRLLAAGAGGQVENLSDAGRAACRALARLAEALSPSARPHHNLCVYLFEHARWLRRLLPAEVQHASHEARSVLATVGQTLDLASAFAAQRDALARRSRDEEAVAAADAPETDADTRAFLAYVRAALGASGGLGAAQEIETGGDAVSVLTAHRSKGLEWPVVFVPFCVQGQFPLDERDAGAGALPPLLPPGLIVTDGAGAAEPALLHDREEACLFYVALTRARDRLYLSHHQAYPHGQGTRKPAPSPLLAAVCERLEAEGRLHRLSDPPSGSASPEPEDAAGAPATIPFDFGTEIHEAALAAYKECPRRFLFENGYGLRDPETAFLRYREVVYGTLALAREVPPGPGRAAALREAFEALWQEKGPADGHWQAPLYRRAAESLLQRVTTAEAAAPGPGAALRAPKQVSLIPEGAAAPCCTVLFSMDEEAEQPDGKRLFLRHKSASVRVPDKAPEDDRTTAYAVYAEQEGVDAAFAVHYPHAGRSLPLTVSATKKKNWRKSRLQIVEDIRAGRFAPKRGGHCGGCPHRLVCPPGD